MKLYETLPEISIVNGACRAVAQQDGLQQLSNRTADDAEAQTLSSQDGRSKLFLLIRGVGRVPVVEVEGGGVLLEEAVENGGVDDTDKGLSGGRRRKVGSAP